MAYSTCIKCGGTFFEMVAADRVSKANYKYYFVQCSSCGGVVGVLDYFHLPTKIDEVKKAVESKSSSSDAYGLQVINNNISTLINSIAVLAKQVKQLSEKLDKKEN